MSSSAEKCLKMCSERGKQYSGSLRLVLNKWLCAAHRDSQDEEDHTNTGHHLLPISLGDGVMPLFHLVCDCKVTHYWPWRWEQASLQEAEQIISNLTLAVLDTAWLDRTSTNEQCFLLSLWLGDDWNTTVCMSICLTHLPFCFAWDSG